MTAVATSHGNTIAHPGPHVPVPLARRVYRVYPRIVPDAPTASLQTRMGGGRGWQVGHVAKPVRVRPCHSETFQNLK
jgi:hypothetical protein